MLVVIPSRKSLTRPPSPRSAFFSPAPLVSLVTLVTLAVALPAFADGPILHEYVPFDPASDGDLGLVTLEGGFAAEIQTRSGKVSAPDVGRPITPRTPLYSTRSAVPDASFTPDRDARRVDHLPYDDPFRPSLAPFKRLVALDAVDADYRLRVRSRARTIVALEREESPKEPVDALYADFGVELRAGEPIRIPTPIAGSVVKRARLSPSVGFRLERDVAENLFIVAEGGGTARLVMELASPRDAFAGETSSYDWGDMKVGLLPALPANVQKAADVFATELGIDKSTKRPHEAIALMVKYFREFKESEDPPPTTGDIYLDLARGKKGVCRHRAFAMMVTALGLGIPARFVYNEAHAWVEVHDGYLWRRIDLGGAGRILDDRTERHERPQPHHDPPSDPHGWPPGATKGSDLVPPVRPGSSSPGGAAGTPPTALPRSGTPPSTSPPSSPSQPLPPSSVTVAVAGATSSSELHEVSRAKDLAVRGHVAASDGSACKKVRVEIVLRGGGDERVAGVLATDDDGNYDGDVTIPSDIALGDYALAAHTPGGGTCGQGMSD